MQRRLYRQYVRDYLEAYETAAIAAALKQQLRGEFSAGFVRALQIQVRSTLLRSRLLGSEHRRALEALAEEGAAWRAR